MQNRKSFARCLLKNGLKGKVRLTLEKGALNLQRGAGNLSKKALVASLLLFLTFSVGTSLYILMASFFRKAESVVHVTPIRFPKNVNQPGERCNHWERTLKATGSTPVKDTRREPSPLPNAAPASPAFQH